MVWNIADLACFCFLSGFRNCRFSFRVGVVHISLSGGKYSIFGLGSPVLKQYHVTHLNKSLNQDMSSDKALILSLYYLVN